MIKTELSNFDKVGNMLRVANTPYGYSLAEGKLARHYTRRILGYNDTVGTSLEDITETSANINIPATATLMEMDSTSVADTAAGTGIQAVEIHGLDSSYNEISEQVEMNGQTAVATVNAYLRINNIHAMRVGTGGSAAGTVTIQSVGGATEYARIGIGGSMMLQALLTVPANHEAYIVGWTAGVTTKDARVILRASADWDDRKLLPGIFHFQDIIVAASSTVYRPFQILLKCPTKCDIKVSGEALLAGAQVSASVDLWYEKV